MRTVRDEDGREFLLLKESGESSRLRDPETGEECHRPTDELTVVDGATPLETAANGVPEAVRALLTATPSERALGLLLDLDERGPTPARTLTSAYDLCESDLNGLLTQFRVAGLIEETRVAGRPGYRTTERATEAIDRLRDDE